MKCNGNNNNDNIKFRDHHQQWEIMKKNKNLILNQHQINILISYKKIYKSKTKTLTRVIIIVNQVKLGKKSNGIYAVLLLLLLLRFILIFIWFHLKSKNLIATKERTNSKEQFQDEDFKMNNQMRKTKIKN